MRHHGEDESDEARLLYVAMTRATQQLLLHHTESEFTRRIRASINDVQTHLLDAPRGQAGLLTNS